MAGNATFSLDDTSASTIKEEDVKIDDMSTKMRNHRDSIVQMAQDITKQEQEEEDEAGKSKCSCLHMNLLAAGGNVCLKKSRKPKTDQNPMVCMFVVTNSPKCTHKVATRA